MYNIYNILRLIYRKVQKYTINRKPINRYRFLQYIMYRYIFIYI